MVLTLRQSLVFASEIMDVLVSARIGSDDLIGHRIDQRRVQSATKQLLGW